MAYDNVNENLIQIVCLLSEHAQALQASKRIHDSPFISFGVLKQATVFWIAPFAISIFKPLCREVVTQVVCLFDFDLHLVKLEFNSRRGVSR